MADGLKAITEAEFLGQVLDLAKLCGWWRAHFRPARTAKGDWRTPCQADAKGFPDLLLLRRGRIVVAECKRSPREKPTAEQLVWLERFRAVPGVEVFLWTPADWDAIERTLA